MQQGDHKSGKPGWSVRASWWAGFRATNPSASPAYRPQPRATTWTRQGLGPLLEPGETPFTPDAAASYPPGVLRYCGPARLVATPRSEGAGCSEGLSPGPYLNPNSLSLSWGRVRSQPSPDGPLTPERVLPACFPYRPPGRDGPGSGCLKSTAASFRFPLRRDMNVSR